MANQDAVTARLPAVTARLPDVTVRLTAVTARLTDLALCRCFIGLVIGLNAETKLLQVFLMILLQISDNIFHRNEVNGQI